MLENNILIVVGGQDALNKNAYTRKTLQRIAKICSYFDAVLLTVYCETEHSPRAKLLGDGFADAHCEPDVDILNFAQEALTTQFYSVPNDALIRALRKCNNDSTPRTVFLAGLSSDCILVRMATDLFEWRIRPIVLTKYIATNRGRVFGVAAIHVLAGSIGRRHLRHDTITERESIAKIRSDLSAVECYI